MTIEADGTITVSVVISKTTLRLHFEPDGKVRLGPRLISRSRLRTLIDELASIHGSSNGGSYVAAL